MSWRRIHRFRARLSPAEARAFERAVTSFRAIAAPRLEVEDLLRDTAYLRGAREEQARHRPLRAERFGGESW